MPAETTSATAAPAARPTTSLSTPRSYATCGPTSHCPSRRRLRTLWLLGPCPRRLLAPCPRPSDRGLCAVGDIPCRSGHPNRDHDRRAVAMVQAPVPATRPHVREGCGDRGRWQLVTPT